MKTNKQTADFLYIGKAILDWYAENARDLPWRRTKNPYHVWISEVILQQTQVKQGQAYYLDFISRFPDVIALARAETDEVLRYWKGLGYYSRALNLHTAARQIVERFSGIFPSKYEDIIQLKGIGKYTAAAIASICYDVRIPAVDGNFYRVFSRLFADGFDISKSTAYAYFSEMAMNMMPKDRVGDFNQAIMDFGSQICKPKKPLCDVCPLQKYCLAYGIGKVHDFPFKLKKVKVETLFLEYFFVECEGQFLIKKRSEDFIWKRLYEFPMEIPEIWHHHIVETQNIKHKLTHRHLDIRIHEVFLESFDDFQNFAKEGQFLVVDYVSFKEKAFPRPLEKLLEYRRVKLKLV